jgi:crotonobetainyl-CoA:carnitine CoA-transferase CaiB-like acyl-CoA transferase
VADFSRVLAGPYATMLMADMGADVIKVEPPHGDDTRLWTPPVDSSGRATYFAATNRNKRSVALDLTISEGLSRARELALSADVVIENFRPGVMARFGLDHETLSQSNPRLITCSITGFGRREGAALPGYDLLVQAMGGLMSITGDPHGNATKVGVAMVDVITGLHALNGIQAALIERSHSGQGQFVEVNLLSSLLSGLVNQASAMLGTGVSPGRAGNAHPSIAPYEPYPTASGELVVAVGNERQFQRLCDVLGHPGMADDDRFRTNHDRVSNRAALRDALVPLLAARSAADWTALLQQAGVPAGPVNDIGQAFELAESLGLHPVVELGAGGRTSRQVANPVAFSRTPVSYRAEPPDLDEHHGATWGSDMTADTMTASRVP